MKVLLLEDDRDSREALAALLTLDNYAIREAADAGEFAAATVALDVDAVIFDLRLADESDALALVMNYQQRRSAAGQPPAHLVCLSGSHATELAGATPFPIARRLRKPADYGVVLAALRGRGSD